MSQENKSRDLFAKLKHIAYVMSQPPARQAEPTLEGFLQYARFEICSERGIAFYDKIWDSYSDEQLLTEYFALRFSKDEEYRKNYESETGTPLEDDVAWFERQIAENKKSRDDAAPAKPQEGKSETPAEEGFDDTPESLMKETEDGAFD